MGLKAKIASGMPFLGKYKRWAKAFADTSLPGKKSYSQYGEDIFVTEMLRRLEIPKDAFYIDVGANHPTDISNTYLLYRSGYQGVIVEPNSELIGLFRKFRKRDIPIAVGCSDKVQVLQFSISKTPVISSFVNDDKAVDVYRKEYLPVLPLDHIMKAIPSRQISLLSIDVEGLNLEVITGGLETLSRTAVLCVEFDDAEEEKAITTLVAPYMVPVTKIHCNLIFVARSLAAKVDINQM